MTIPQILEAQDGSITAAVDAFKTELEGVVSAAKAKLQARLQAALVLDAAGNIKRTRGNSKVLASIDQMFIEEMAASGFVHLSREFVNTFPGQLPYFDLILEEITAQTKTPIKFSWTAADKRTFTDFGTNTRLSLESVVANVASQATQNILLTFGSLKYADLLVLLAKRLDVVVPRVVTLADTAIATFFRTVSDVGYRKLEFYFKEIRYKYFGPIDSLNRPFCKRMATESAAGKSWSREELDGMTNGTSLPGPVLIVAGGWACRHHMAMEVGSAQASA